MSRPCRVYGCAGHASRFGLYCPAHKSALRRHGHPEQDAITKAELKPYVAQVRRRVARNAENATWSHCEARWRAIVELARGVVAEAERGQAGNRHERSAAAEVVRLGAAIGAVEIMETVFALYLLQEAEPRRFRSDDAFLTQLVRRLRGLVEANAEVWTNKATGQTKRAYRELAPRAAMIIARWVVTALGGVGVHLARLEARDKAEQQASRQELAEAMRDLQ